MSAVLFREGDDLDQLLAELDAEHPDGVRVVDVRYDREGGVLGFFARRRVAVSYTPADYAPAGSESAAFESAAFESAAFESAAFESASFEPAEPAPAAAPAMESETDPVDDRAEFARMLLDMAAEKAAERSREDDPVIDPYDVFTRRGRHAAPDPDEGLVAPPPGVVTWPLATPSVAAPVAPPAAAASTAAASPAATSPVAAAFAVAPSPVAPPSVAPSSAASSPAAEAFAVAASPVGPPPVAPFAVDPSPVAPPPAPASPALPPPAAASAPAASGDALAVRRRLLDLGIPGGWLPADGADPVAAIRGAVARLRPARPPKGTQFVLVVAGPAALALETAREVHHRLGLRRPVLTVGIDATDAEAQLRDERQAGWLAADVRLGDGGPAVVAVSLDQQVGNGWDDAGTGRILDRLLPDTVWGVADARWRSSDVRALFAQLPRTDALAITYADRTGSPAALLELDLPVALLDGRPATPAAWTALLLDRLDALG